MQSRYSFVATLLLLTVACARQEDPGDMPTTHDDDDSGGTLNLGGKASTGGKPPALGGSTGSTSTGTSGSTGKGGGTALPPSGSIGGKGGTKSTGGSSGSANDGGESTGTGGSGGSGGGGSTVNMPVDGLTMAFKPDSTSSEVDWLGGELLFTNDSAEDFALGDLKIRYYFTNEVASPMTEVRWSQFGPASNMGGKTCTATLVEMPTAKAGADSYIELTCEAGDMAAGSALKTSWRAGSNGGGIFKLQQADDYSFSAVDHIVVLNGSTVIWGAEP